MPTNFLKLVFSETNRSITVQLDEDRPFGLTVKGIVYRTHQPRFSIFYRKPKWHEIVLRSPEVNISDHVIPLPDLHTQNVTYLVYIPNESCMETPDGGKMLIIKEAIHKKWIGKEDTAIQKELDKLEDQLKEVKKDQIKTFGRMIKFVKEIQEDQTKMGINMSNALADRQELLERIASQKSETKREDTEEEELEDEVEEIKEKLEESIEIAQKEGETETGTTPTPEKPVES